MFIRTSLGALPGAVDDTLLTTEAFPAPPPVKLPPRPVPAVVPRLDFTNVAMQAGNTGFVPPSKRFPSPVPAVRPPSNGQTPGGTPAPSVAPLLLSALAFFLFRGKA